METKPEKIGFWKNWRNWVIFRPFIDLYNSLFNNDNGFSFRKAASTFSIFIASEISRELTDDGKRLKAILYWMVFASVLIGLVTIPQLIQYLVSRGAPPKDSEPK